MKTRQAGMLTMAALMAIMMALGLVFLSNDAIARPDGPHGPHGKGCGGGGGHLGAMEQQLDSLDLEAGKRDAIYGLLDQARKEGRSFRSEMKAAHEAMRELLAQDNPDVGAVMAQADALGALKTEARKAQLRTLVAIRGQLTSEQWQTLHERFESKRHRRGR